MELEFFGVQLTPANVSLVETALHWAGYLIVGALFIYRVSPFAIRSPYLGNWYGYNSSRKGGEAFISRERWKIRPKLAGLGRDLIVIAWNEELPHLKYEGVLKVDQDNHDVIIQFRRRHSHESYTFRFQESPDDGLPHPLLGFWVGRSHEARTVAGMVLVDRQQHSNEELRVIWDTNLANQGDRHILQLRSDYHH